MKVLSSMLFALVSIQLCSAQTDTIYSFNKKIPCEIIEITTDAVKYTNLKSTLPRSIYKNAVEKLVYKNGEIETFANLTNLRKINSAYDYHNVVITRIESDVQGLYRIGEVGSKARGTTRLSSQEKVKNRAYIKLQMFGALMGANVIFITNQSTRGNLWVGSSETNLSGIGYTNYLLDIDEFKSILGDRKDFKSDFLVNMMWSATQLFNEDFERKFQIAEVLQQNGQIFITGNLENEPYLVQFRVVYFDRNSFTIVYQKNNVIYNLRFPFQ